MHRFAERNGYSIRVVESDACHRRGGWIKIQPILQVMAEGFDYILWLDVDTFVTKPDADIRRVMHERVQLHMAWHYPVGTNDPPHFNTGVMLVRNSAWSRSFFDQVWELGPIEHHWNDQAAIHGVLGLNEALRMGANREDSLLHPVSPLDIRWNSIPKVCAMDDPIIWHFAGMKMSERIAAMAACARPLRSVGRALAWLW
jgi:hypothetical protein